MKRILIWEKNSYYGFNDKILTIILELCHKGEAASYETETIEQTNMDFLPCGFPREVLRIHQLNLQFVALMIQINRYIGNHCCDELFKVSIIQDKCPN